MHLDQEVNAPNRATESQSWIERDIIEPNFPWHLL